MCRPEESFKREKVGVDNERERREGRLHHHAWLWFKLGEFSGSSWVFQSNFNRRGPFLTLYRIHLVVDEFTRYIQEEVACCISYANDIVLVNETRGEMISKVERWGEVLEFKRFRISKTEIYYINAILTVLWEWVLDDQESILHENGEIEKDIMHLIKTRWLNGEMLLDLLWL